MDCRGPACETDGAAFQEVVPYSEDVTVGSIRDASRRIVANAKNSNGHVLRGGTSLQNMEAQLETGCEDTMDIDTSMDGDIAQDLFSTPDASNMQAEKHSVQSVRRGETEIGNEAGVTKNGGSVEDRGNRIIDGGNVGRNSRNGINREEEVGEQNSDDGDTSAGCEVLSLSQPSTQGSNGE